MTKSQQANIEKILLEIEKVLQALISNAKTLQESSRKAISQQELDLLQTAQEKLLSELMEKENQFQEVEEQELSNKNALTRKCIEEKLDYFEKLNADFIDNLGTSHNLIKFEKRFIRKPKK